MKKHGLTKTRIYWLWRDMKARCTNPRHAAYENYGGRGIAVCELWMRFENFYADMGDKPAGRSLDRINNDGPYSPKNCRWATIDEQKRNTRATRLITFNGVTMARGQWERQLGLGEGTLFRRLQRGMSLSEALQPIKKEVP